MPSNEVYERGRHMIGKDEYYPFIEGDGLVSIYDREGWDKKKLLMLFDFLKQVNSFDTFECWADTSQEGRMNVLSCGPDSPFVAAFDIGEGEPCSFTLFDEKAQSIVEAAKVVIVERPAYEISISSGSKSMKRKASPEELRDILSILADRLLSALDQDSV
jgi:hypothetical protein